MSDVLNWGILGAAKFACEHMGPAIHMAPGARLTALATSSAEKSSPFKAFCPDIKVHQSYDDLLADPTIEAVYIPLPNTLHIEWAKKALEAGKHVLVEKPVAMQAEEVDALITLRDQTGLIAAEAYMIVHHAQWQRARELLAGGAIGELAHISCAFSFDNRDPDNIRNKRNMGGGALPDIGVYILGCARYVTGLEGQVTGAQIEFENGVDVMARVQAMFGDASYSGYVSTRMHPFQEVTFHGRKGVLKLTAPFNANVYDIARIELHQPNLSVQVERFPAENHYFNQVVNFCASVRGDATYPWSLENARGTQAMIDAVYQAAK